MIPAPQFTDEQRQQLQASITESLRGIQAAFEAVGRAMENAARGLASVQDACALELPPAEQCDQHPNAPRIGDMCGGCTQYPSDMAKDPLSGYAANACWSSINRSGDRAH